MKNKLPNNIVNRRQHGFNVPIQKWFKDDIFKESDYFNETDIKKKQHF